jgi:glutamate-1-semialdehyde 2,1-aminomutase
MSAAAGIATLRQIRDHGVTERANGTAAAIRDGLNRAIQHRGLPWCAYGLFSDFHVYCGDASPDDIYDGKVPWRQLKGGIAPELSHKIRTAMLVHGVDITGWPGGVVSAAHTEEDVTRTTAAFEATLEMLQAEGEV